MSKVEQLTEIIMPALTNRFQLNILHNNKSFDSLKYQLIKMQEDSTKKEITLIFEVEENAKSVPEPCQNGTVSAFGIEVNSLWKVSDWR